MGFFITTVAGLVLEPMPPGAWALLCAAAASAAHALTFEEAVQAAGSQVMWLIVTSFLLAKVGERGNEQPGAGSLCILLSASP